MLFEEHVFGLMFNFFCFLVSYEFDDIEFIGYIEPVLVILHEKELTWVGRMGVFHISITCVISTLSISTTLKRHQLIWSPTTSSYYSMNT
ncbi:hypothetical protein Hanom_Chr13g01184311 [Helianthus anomalus]